MSSKHPTPLDQQQRMRGLNVDESVLVQAPAGSGKTDLLTRRFLALLSKVDSPSEIVAITFTRAAAAEMRQRIVAEIEKAAAQELKADSINADEDPAAVSKLARRALQRSAERQWQLLELPAQLRITTIDSFCRELALGQPMVSGLGSGMEPSDQPEQLYRRAARRVLSSIDQAPERLQQALELILLWRDNHWMELENLLVKMLGQRDRWMRDFVLDQEPDEEQLRARLERPFARAAQATLERVSQLLDDAPAVRKEAHSLAKFACGQLEGEQFRNLAEMVDLPTGPFNSMDEIAEAQTIYNDLADFLLTKDGKLRRAVNKSNGFGTNCIQQKEQMLQLLTTVNAIADLEATLASVRTLPPSRFSEEEWQIVCAAFTLLVHSAAELRMVFAEAGQTDFVEIAQTALGVLRGEEDQPAESAWAMIDGIRHLLVDEFQDTSRRQHELLGRLIGAWPDAAGRTCFVVGDPMQSIYFFRDAEAELFARVRNLGLELPASATHTFHFAQLQANFRTEPSLVEDLNVFFARVFNAYDGSGVRFAEALPSRAAAAEETAAFGESDFAEQRLQLHLKFVPSALRSTNSELKMQRIAAHRAQVDEMVELIRRHQLRIDATIHRNQTLPLSEHKKYRVAVLGRSKRMLAPLAAALTEALIPFRAVDLVELKARPEIRDALALARAALNPQDRVAWLTVLRAPWAALSLQDLHAITSCDSHEQQNKAIPGLLEAGLNECSPEGRAGVERVQRAFAAAPLLRFANPATTLGSWVEQLWKSIGGEACVDATGRANLHLLWQTLDALPNGEEDLLGSGIDTALDKLTALADPTVSEDCGVQLMSIHKSKGLEFEVVIVPELQGRASGADFALLSWLERGLAEPDEGNETTEFLIAPLQARGEESGGARTFVNNARIERERQEMRRLLYVAATRAREELHLFARPEYAVNKNGELTLAEPKNTLLATAWPAVQDEVRLAFSNFVFDQEQAQQKIEEVELENGCLALSASSENTSASIAFPRLAEARPTRMNRLPLSYTPANTGALLNAEVGSHSASIIDQPLYARHEGSLQSRTLGVAVHTLLERLATLRKTHTWAESRTLLTAAAAATRAALRSMGLARIEAQSMAAEALTLALNASHDPVAQWLLAPHAQAASEQRWTGLIKGGLRNLQADRVFLAGDKPEAEGQSAWWVIDFKTAQADEEDPQAALPTLRERFRPQLEAYAAMLKNLHGEDVIIHLGLYYPRIQKLDWWKDE